jgi:hypothetical protein
MASSFHGAIIGYKGTMESLSWGTVLMTFLATPMFYLLFFFFVRLQSIPEDQITLYLLLSILILPTGSCVFYLGSSFHKLKMWGVLRYLLISERSLLNIALHKALVTVTLAFVVSCFWLIVLELFFIDSGLSWQQWLTFVFVLLLSCLVFICFGILCATLVLPMKDRLITTNSLFFIVILFSGILFQVDTGWLYWTSHVLPITPFVSILKNVYAGEQFSLYLVIALSNAGLYLLISHLLLHSTVTKLMKGDVDY